MAIRASASACVRLISDIPLAVRVNSYIVGIQEEGNAESPRRKLTSDSCTIEPSLSKPQLLLSRNLQPFDLDPVAADLGKVVVSLLHKPAFLGPAKSL
jgi:hypothetical protein